MAAPKQDHDSTPGSLGPWTMRCMIGETLRGYRVLEQLGSMRAPSVDGQWSSSPRPAGATTLGQSAAAFRPPASEPRRRARWPWVIVPASAPLAGPVAVVLPTGDEQPAPGPETPSPAAATTEASPSENTAARARPLQGTTGWIMTAAGGVATLAGAIMLNSQYSKSRNEPAAAQSFVVPVLSPTTAGVAAGISF